MTVPVWLNPDEPENFPALDNALQEPNGLLAVGGDLSPQRLLAAYRQGIFPWYSKGQPILWWSPDPRAILIQTNARITRSLAKTLRQNRFHITIDTVFSDVMHSCAAPRATQTGTWITEEMCFAYQKLHTMGYAHSIECWLDKRLVGGLYGIALGQVFFGESMFSTESNASKVAFVHLLAHLIHWGFQLVDCQVESPHVMSLGAITIPRAQFRTELDRLCLLPGKPDKWQADSVLQATLCKTGYLSEA